MPRKPTLNDRTAGEDHREFTELVGRLGMSVSEREAAVQRIPIDGIVGGERQRERRHAKTSFYSNSYVEALSAAGLIVDLAMARLVENVRRLSPPMPDVEVVLHDGSSIFIEQTNVIDREARLLSIAIEQANYRALELAKSHPQAAAAIEHGTFFIRLDDLTFDRVGESTNAEALARELCELAATLKEPAVRLAPDSSKYPTLSGLGARYSYKPGAMTGSIIMPPMNHGRLAKLEAAFSERVSSKIDKRAGYGTLGHPLWLVLDVDHHFYVSDEHLRILASHVMNEFDTSGFDVVAVQYVRSKPMIFQQPQQTTRDNIT